jgi:hypothetical protein
MGFWDKWKTDDDDDPNVRFMTAGQEVEGVIEEISSTRFGPGKPLFPVLNIKTGSGAVKIVTADKVVLLKRLVEAGPEVGDHILITYQGESPNSKPGQNPAKLFDVVVTPKTLMANGKKASPAAEPAKADEHGDEPF